MASSEAAAQAYHFEAVSLSQSGRVEALTFR
jgi:hypothetical protein